MATHPTGPAKSRISLVVDDELKSRIGKKAAENGISMNAYIEAAVAEALRAGLSLETRAVYKETASDTQRSAAQRAVKDLINLATGGAMEITHEQAKQISEQLAAEDPGTYKKDRPEYKITPAAERSQQIDRELESMKQRDDKRTNSKKKRA